MASCSCPYIIGKYLSVCLYILYLAASQNSVVNVVLAVLGGGINGKVVVTQNLFRLLHDLTVVVLIWTPRQIDMVLVRPIDQEHAR